MEPELDDGVIKEIALVSSTTENIFSAVATDTTVTDGLLTEELWIPVVTLAPSEAVPSSTEINSFPDPTTSSSIFSGGALTISSVSSVPTTLITSTSKSPIFNPLQTPVPDQARPSVSEGLPIGAIVGIIIGVLALLVAFILLRALLKQHKALKTGVGSPHYRDHLIPGFVSTRNTQPSAQGTHGDEKTPTISMHEMPATESKQVQELTASERPYELPSSK